MIYIKCSARSLQVETSTDVSFSHHLMSSTCCFWPLASDLPATIQHKEDVSDQSCSWPLEACRTLLRVTAGRHWRARASSHGASWTFFHLCFLSLDPACLHSQLSRSIYSAGNKICSPPPACFGLPIEPQPPCTTPRSALSPGSSRHRGRARFPPPRMMESSSSKVSIRSTKTSPLHIWSLLCHHLLPVLKTTGAPSI